ncbi:hypothetical protein L484_019770 [Morus notabilis]|uniref:F-box protein SKIP19 n=2 Tax=Morus notabilis TaxID=981085 RepID=W9RDP4_9ROSA|nr:hypothetical protein L484_019770 [Morus notabilis]
MHNLGELDSNLDLDKMCRNAVARSRGRVVDINIEYFGNDELLKYITDRAKQIKRLRLSCCYYVSDEALIEALAKLPLLVELDLTLCLFTTEPIEASGRTCPRLKTFKLNWQAFRFDHINPEEEVEFSDEAIAIGKNMPRLRHLQLIGNAMIDIGLKAILDGCPHLESLDLRRCLNICLKGNVWKRCVEQVKYLWLPDDPTKDYGFITGPEDERRSSSSEDCFRRGSGLGFPFDFDEDYDDDNDDGGDDYDNDYNDDDDDNDDGGDCYNSGSIAGWLDTLVDDDFTRLDTFEDDDFTRPDYF